MENKEDMKPANTEEVKATGQEEKVEKATESKIEEPTSLELQLRAKWDLEKEREIDKRVSEAVKKRDVKFKTEQAEKERLSRLSEEEKYRELQAEKERELEDRHKELVAKELKLELVDILTENNLPLEFRSIIDVNKYVGAKAEDRLDGLKADIATFKETFDSIITATVADIKKEYLKGNSPVNSDTSVAPTSAYEKARKAGDVRGMISAKLNGSK